VKTGTTLAIVVLASAAVWTNIREQDRTSDEVAVRALDEQARIAALSP
jgi:hypothetical protein